MLQLAEIIIKGWQDFIKHLQGIKENTHLITFIFSIVLSCFFYPIGGVNALTVGLIVFVVIDYITGIRRSQKLGILSSSKGIKGLEKKAYMYLVIVMANIADKVLNIGDSVLNWRIAVTAMYLGLEGVSVLENLDDMGFKTPAGLRKLFKFLIEKEQNWRKNDESDKNKK